MPGLADLLAVSAARFPDRPCMIDRSGRSVTYGEFDGLVARVAARLGALGIAPGDRVGLAAPKSVDTIAALFGILRAGAAYVPVDPTAPAARSAGIFADCQVRHVLADGSVSGDLFGEMAGDHPVAVQDGVLSFDLASASGDCAPGDPETAYILYTSGSTGKPKGVVHSHASALAFVDWCSGMFAPTEADRFSSHAPIHFDLSILDLYVSVKHGAAVRLIDAVEARQPGGLSQLVEAEKLTIWYSTPTILRAMISEGGLGDVDLSALRVVCFAGEVYPTKHLKTLAKTITGAELYNLYGPTETNVCTYYHLTDAAGLPDDETIPIGFAASGDSCRVAEDDGTAVPAGARGELLIAGPSVMQGYWNLPERNAECFVTVEGRDWYRTGDVVHERADGALIYAGRRDRMVKRRGYRIELGEIEAAMLRHGEIEQVATVAVTDGDGEVQIVSFPEWKGGAAPSLIALKRFAAANLPMYMVPDRFQSVDSLPQTSTDKIDFQKLKEMARGLFKN